MSISQSENYVKVFVGVFEDRLYLISIGFSLYWSSRALLNSAIRLFCSSMGNVILAYFALFVVDIFF